MIVAVNKGLRNLLPGFAKGLLLFLPLLLASPSKAYGYVDPGSGSFVYQAIYAVCIGGAFYFRKLLSRIFGKRDK